MIKFNSVAPDSSQDDPNLFGEDLGKQPSEKESSVAPGELVNGLDDNSKEGVEQTPVFPEMTEEQFWAELKIMGSLRTVEQKRYELEDEIKEQTEKVNDAKNVLEDREEELDRLRSEHKEATDLLLDNSRKLLLKSEGKQLPIDEPTEEDEVWRSKLTAELLKGVKGISKSKLEVLVEVCPTVGELEDLRAEASKQHKEFSELLPNGFGKAIAERIVNCMINWIGECAAAQIDPDRQRLADELVEEIREVAAESGWLQEDCIPTEEDDEHVHDGFTAFQDGRSHTNMLSMDRPKARQWMIGWVGAEWLSNLKEGNAA